MRGRQRILAGSYRFLDYPKSERAQWLVFMSSAAQEHFGDSGVVTAGIRYGTKGIEDVKVIEIKTVGAYEVAVVSAGDAAKLGEWLDAHQFIFPATSRDVLDSYIKKHWYFVAARVIPDQSGFALKSGGPKRHLSPPRPERSWRAGNSIHWSLASPRKDACSRWRSRQ